MWLSFQVLFTATAAAFLHKRAVAGNGLVLDGPNRSEWRGMSFHDNPPNRYRENSQRKLYWCLV